MATNNFRFPLVAAAALAFAPLTASATVTQAIPFDQKVEKAESIVLGKVVSQESRWDDQKKWILTYSTFEIEKTFKGMPAQRVTLVTPGGTVGNIAQNVVGVPRFRNGDESVVFVRNTKSGPTVLYLEQGAYRVVKDGRGDRIVRPVASSAVMVDSQRGMAVSETERPLRAFEERVRNTIRDREAVRMEMLEKQKREQESSLWAMVARNKALVALALLGAALATWQLLRRS
jgi:hypothetical protein